MFKKTSIQRTGLILLIIFCLSGYSKGQTIGRTGIVAYSSYSYPLAGLSEWFKPALNYGIGIGGYNDRDWYFEGLVEYSRFDEENMQSYSAGKVDLSLEHIGFIFNTKYHLADAGFLKPYLNFAVGLFYWKGIRGEIQPDDSVQPPIPYIEQRVLEEWNFGFRSGLGIEMPLTSQFSADLTAYYRLVVGDLWPTLQPHVELESVSGFQTLNIALQVRFYF